MIGRRASSGRLAPSSGPGLPLVVLVALLAACSDKSSSSPPGLHDRRTMPTLLGQAVLACNDGTAVDVDFLDQGLSMAITWLPDRRAEELRASRTGGVFVGPRTRATIVGGTTAFEQAGGRVRVCHRPA